MIELTGDYMLPFREHDKNINMKKRKKKQNELSEH